MEEYMIDDLFVVYKHCIHIFLSKAKRDPYQIQNSLYFQYNDQNLDLDVFCRNLFDRFQCSLECYVISLIYINRFFSTNQSVIAEDTMKNIIISSLVLAQKFFDEISYKSRYYAEFANLQVSELHNLEVDFLCRIHFSLRVTSKEYLDIYKQLQGHCRNLNALLPDICDIDHNDECPLLKYVFNEALEQTRKERYKRSHYHTHHHHNYQQAFSSRATTKSLNLSSSSAYPHPSSVAPISAPFPTQSSGIVQSVSTLNYPLPPESNSLHYLSSAGSFSSSAPLPYNRPPGMTIVQEPPSFLTQSISGTCPPSSFSSIPSNSSIDLPPGIPHPLSHSLSQPVVLPHPYSYSTVNSNANSLTASVNRNCPSIQSADNLRETIPLPPIKPPFPCDGAPPTSASDSSRPTLPPLPPPPTSLSSSSNQHTHIKQPGQLPLPPPPPLSSSSSSLPRPPRALTNSHVPLPPPRSLPNDRSSMSINQSAPSLPYPLTQSSTTHTVPNNHLSFSQSTHSPQMHYPSQPSQPNQSISCLSSNPPSVENIHGNPSSVLPYPVSSPPYQSHMERNDHLSYSTSNIRRDSEGLSYPIQVQGSLPPIPHPYQSYYSNQSANYDISQSISSVSSSSISNSTGTNSILYTGDKSSSQIVNSGLHYQSVYDQVPNLAHPLSGY